MSPTPTWPIITYQKLQLSEKEIAVFCELADIHQRLYAASFMVFGGR